MQRAWSCAACLALAVSALAALATLFPSAAVAMGLDVWNVPAFQAMIDAEADRARRLDDLDREAFRRAVAKEEIAGQVARGSLTLEEGAARFRELNATAPEDQQRAWREYTEGSTDEERARNSVRRFVDRIRAGDTGTGR